jgi:hypothetical protein
VDFFERYLGISPDGGDGSAEVLFLFALFAIIALIAWRLHVTKLQILSDLLPGKGQ